MMCEQVLVRTCVTLSWGENTGVAPNPTPYLIPIPLPHGRADGRITFSTLLLSSMKHLLTTSFFPPTVSHIWVHPTPVSPVPAGAGPALSHRVPFLASWGHWNPRDLSLLPSQPLRPEELSPPQLLTQRSPLKFRGNVSVCLLAPSLSPHQLTAAIPAPPRLHFHPPPFSSNACNSSPTPSHPHPKMALRFCSKNSGGEVLFLSLKLSPCKYSCAGGRGRAVIHRIQAQLRNSLASPLSLDFGVVT